MLIGHRQSLESQPGAVMPVTDCKDLGALGLVSHSTMAEFNRRLWPSHSSLNLL